MIRVDERVIEVKGTKRDLMANIMTIAHYMVRINHIFTEDEMHEMVSIGSMSEEEIKRETSESLDRLMDEFLEFLKSKKEEH